MLRAGQRCFELLALVGSPQHFYSFPWSRPRRTSNFSVRIEQVNFFNWLSNVKNLVFPNGYEHMRNVIQWH